MAVTRQDITIPAGIWTNCYTASGITVGTAVSVFNKGTANALLAISTAAPTTTTIGIPIYNGDVTSAFRSVSASEVGLWAYSVKGTSLLIQES